jgi:hypothetical protein
MKTYVLHRTTEETLQANVYEPKTTRALPAAARRRALARRL